MANDGLKMIDKSPAEAQAYLKCLKRDLLYLPYLWKSLLPFIMKN